MFKLNFEPEEFQRRLATVQARMAARGFDMLVIGEPANMYYLTGYNCYSFYSPQVLIVPAKGAPVFYVRFVDGPAAIATSCLPADNVRAYPESYVQKLDCHPFDWVAADLRKRGLDKGTIGVEMEGNNYSVRGHLALQKGLPEAKFVDSQDLVNWVRTVKSPAELAKMRVAGKIVDRMMTAALGMIEPGVRQCDVAAELLRVGTQGLPDAGGDYPAIMPLLPTGEMSGVPHMTWSDQVFKKGEATNIEIAGCYERYHSPLARTIILGQPGQKLAEVADMVGEGMQAALAAVRAGTTGEAVEAVWRGIIEPRGYVKTGRIAYPIGLGYPPDWGERTVSFRPGDRVPLQSGMTFHLILGMWMDGWGYELSETIAVTETGHECFASMPRKLTVKQ